MSWPGARSLFADEGGQVDGDGHARGRRDAGDPVGQITVAGPDHDGTDFLPEEAALVERWGEWVKRGCRRVPPRGLSDQEYPRTHRPAAARHRLRRAPLMPHPARRPEPDDLGELPVEIRLDWRADVEEAAAL